MKLIVAIFEGADFDILKGFIQSNRLPNFQKLKNIYRTRCSCIPYEAAGIMSAFSGIPENEHGISSYWKSQNYLYVPQLWTSENIKDEMLWNRPDMKNIKTTIINLWGTHPVYPINGCIISYSMEKSLKYFYPPGIGKELFDNSIFCVQDTCVLYNKNTSRNSFCENVRKIDLMRHLTASYFIENTELLIINYTAIDRISHFFFNDYLENPLESQLFMAYKQCDSILGDLFKYVDKYNSDLIVFSEIGFGKLEKFININDELQKADLLSYFPNGKIDWENTIAFESVQGSHGINLNKKGVFEKGTIISGEYEKKLDFVIDFLKTLTNTETGRPLFKSVIKGYKYYKRSQFASDIILEPFSEEYLPYGDPYWANYLTRNSQTGWHRSNGIFSAVSKKHMTNQDVAVHELFDIIMRHL